MVKLINTNNIPLIWIHLAALLVVSAWGVSFVSTKILLENNMTPTEVFVVRTLLAYIIILRSEEHTSELQSQR